MKANDTNNPEALALAALGWTLSEEARAQRFLALTGLTPDELRAALTEPATLAALIHFLEAHEPDLIACAGALGRSPAELVEARRRLES
jgi:hypothetical protein